jgi:hypothetical protein
LLAGITVHAKIVQWVLPPAERHAVHTAGIQLEGEKAGIEIAAYNDVEMMRNRRTIIALLLTGLLAGCNFPLFAASPTPTEQLVAMAVMASPTAPLPFVPTLPPVYTITPFMPSTLVATFTVAPTGTVLPSLTPIPTATRTRTPTRTPKPKLSRGDLHMHTDCSDGRNTYEEMVTTAIDMGYNFIAITDHHVCDDVIQACLNEDRILCFPGMEVPAAGRLEVLSIGTTTQFPDYLTVKQIVDRVHAQGGIAIAAHPWALEQSYTEDQLLHSGLDAMECLRDGSQTMPFDTSSLPCVYDSDAHSIDVLGDPMVCTGEIKTIDDLRAVITGRLCKPPY